MRVCSESKASGGRLDISPRVDRVSEDSSLPAKGPVRWAHYAGQVVAAAWRYIDLYWGAGLIAVIVAVFAAATALTNIGWAWFLTATFLVLFLVATMGGYRVWSRVELAFRRATAQPRPHLVFAGTEVAPAATVVLATTGIGAAASAVSPSLEALMMGTAASVPAISRGGPNDFARVRIANDPGERIGSRAERVAAKIAFLDENDVLLIEITGRWADNLQRMESGRLNPSHDECRIDIDANGLAESLDIAMKAPTDAHFYAFNHLNCQARDLRLEPHKISVSRCRVRVTVRASNEPQSIARIYVLHNAGVGGSLSLEESDES